MAHTPGPWIATPEVAWSGGTWNIDTEDGKGVGGHRAGRHMKDTGHDLSRDLIHIGKHQQKALGGCEGSCQGTGGKGPVNRTCCSLLRLHLHYP